MIFKNSGMKIGQELSVFTTNLCQEVVLERKLYQVISTGTVDGNTWYTCHCRDNTVWRWLLTQNSKYWQNIPGELAFDIHESLFTLLQLKFS